MIYPTEKFAAALKKKATLKKAMQSTAIKAKMVAKDVQKVQAYNPTASIKAIKALPRPPEFGAFADIAHVAKYKSGDMGYINTLKDYKKITQQDKVFENARKSDLNFAAPHLAQAHAKNLFISQNPYFAAITTPEYSILEQDAKKVSDELNSEGYMQYLINNDDEYEKWQNTYFIIEEVPDPDNPGRTKLDIRPRDPNGYIPPMPGLSEDAKISYMRMGYAQRDRALLDEHMKRLQASKVEHLADGRSETEVNSMADIFFKDAKAERSWKDSKGVSFASHQTRTTNLRKEYNFYESDTYKYLDKYYMENIRNGWYGQAGLNFLNALQDDLDVFTRFGKGLTMRSAAADNPDSKYYFVYSGGQEYQEAYDFSGTYAHNKTMGTSHQTWVPGLAKAYHSKEVQKEYNKYVAERREYIKDNRWGDLKYAMTTLASPEYDTGKLSTDIALELFSDPTLILGLGSTAAASGALKGAVKGVAKTEGKAAAKGVRNMVGHELLKSPAKDLTTARIEKIVQLKYTQPLLKKGKIPKDVILRNEKKMIEDIVQFKNSKQYTFYVAAKKIEGVTDAIDLGLLSIPFAPVTAGVLGFKAGQKIYNKTEFALKRAQDGIFEKVKAGKFIHPDEIKYYMYNVPEEVTEHHAMKAMLEQKYTTELARLEDVRLNIADGTQLKAALDDEVIKMTEGNVRNLEEYTEIRRKMLGIDGSASNAEFEMFKKLTELNQRAGYLKNVPVDSYEYMMYHKFLDVDSFKKTLAHNNIPVDIVKTMADVEKIQEIAKMRTLYDAYNLRINDLLDDPRVNHINYLNRTSLSDKGKEYKKKFKRYPHVKDIHDAYKYYNVNEEGAISLIGNNLNVELYDIIRQRDYALKHLHSLGGIGQEELKALSLFDGKTEAEVFKIFDNHANLRIFLGQKKEFADNVTKMAVRASKETGDVTYRVSTPAMIQYLQTGVIPKLESIDDIRAVFTATGKAPVGVKELRTSIKQAASGKSIEEIEKVFRKEYKQEVYQKLLFDKDLDIFNNLGPYRDKMLEYIGLHVLEEIVHEGVSLSQEAIEQYVRTGVKPVFEKLSDINKFMRIDDDAFDPAVKASMLAELKKSDPGLSAAEYEDMFLDEYYQKVVDKIFEGKYNTLFDQLKENRALYLQYQKSELLQRAIKLMEKDSGAEGALMSLLKGTPNKSRLKAMGFSEAEIAALRRDKTLKAYLHSKKEVNALFKDLGYFAPIHDKKVLEYLEGKDVVESEFSKAIRGSAKKETDAYKLGDALKEATETTVDEVMNKMSAGEFIRPNVEEEIYNGYKELQGLYPDIFLPENKGHFVGKGVVTKFVMADVRVKDPLTEAMKAVPGIEDFSDDLFSILDEISKPERIGQINAHLDILTKQYGGNLINSIVIPKNFKKLPKTIADMWAPLYKLNEAKKLLQDYPDAIQRIDSILIKNNYTTLSIYMDKYLSKIEEAGTIRARNTTLGLKQDVRNSTEFGLPLYSDFRTAIDIFDHLDSRLPILIDMAKRDQRVPEELKMLLNLDTVQKIGFDAQITQAEEFLADVKRIAKNNNLEANKLMFDNNHVYIKEKILNQVHIDSIIEDDIFKDVFESIHTPTEQSKHPELSFVKKYAVEYDEVLVDPEFISDHEFITECKYVLEQAEHTQKYIDIRDQIKADTKLSEDMKLAVLDSLGKKGFRSAEQVVNDVNIFLHNKGGEKLDLDSFRQSRHKAFLDKVPEAERPEIEKLCAEIFENAHADPFMDVLTQEMIMRFHNPKIFDDGATLIDIETTGLNKNIDPITSIGMLELPAEKGPEAVADIVRLVHSHLGERNKNLFRIQLHGEDARRIAPDEDLAKLFYNDGLAQTPRHQWIDAHTLKDGDEITEEHILQTLFDRLSSANKNVCTYNMNGYDMDFIKKRASKYDIITDEDTVHQITELKGPEVVMAGRGSEFVTSSQRAVIEGHANRVARDLGDKGFHPTSPERFTHRLRELQRSYHERANTTKLGALAGDLDTLVDENPTYLQDMDHLLRTTKDQSTGMRNKIYKFPIDDSGNFMVPEELPFWLREKVGDFPNPANVLRALTEDAYFKLGAAYQYDPRKIQRVFEQSSGMLNQREAYEVQNFARDVIRTRDEYLYDSDLLDIDVDACTKIIQKANDLEMMPYAIKVPEDLRMLVATVQQIQRRTFSMVTQSKANRLEDILPTAQRIYDNTYIAKTKMEEMSKVLDDVVAVAEAFPNTPGSTTIYSKAKMLAQKLHDNTVALDKKVKAYEALNKNLNPHSKTIKDATDTPLLEEKTYKQFLNGLANGDSNSLAKYKALFDQPYYTKNSLMMENVEQSNDLLMELTAMTDFLNHNIKMPEPTSFINEMNGAVTSLREKKISLRLMNDVADTNNALSAKTLALTNACKPIEDSIKAVRELPEEQVGAYTKAAHDYVNAMAQHQAETVAELLVKGTPEDIRDFLYYYAPVTIIPNGYIKGVEIPLSEAYKVKSTTTHTFLFLSKEFDGKVGPQKYFKPADFTNVINEPTKTVAPALAEYNKSLYRLAGPGANASTGRYISNQEMESILKSLPEFVTKEMWDVNQMTSPVMFNNPRFDFITLGKLDESYRTGVFRSTDPLIQAQKTMRALMDSQEGLLQYMSLYTNNSENIGVRKLFGEGYSDTEIISELAHTPEYVVTYIVPSDSTKLGFKVKKMNIYNKADLDLAEARNAIIVPNHIYEETFVRLNAAPIHHKLFKAAAYYVYMYKAASLLHFKTWWNNAIDSSRKAMYDIGDVSPFIRQFATATRAMHDYNEIVKTLVRVRGDKTIPADELVKEFHLARQIAKSDMSFETYQLIHGLHTSSPIRGEYSTILADLAIAQRQKRAYSVSDIVDSQGREVRHLKYTNLNEVRKHAEKVQSKYDISVDEFMMYIQLADVQKIKPPGAQMQNMYADVVESMFLSPASVARRNFANTTSALLSASLRPMSRVETQVRLMHAMALAEEGTSNTEIFSRLSKTHFNYAAKSRGMKTLELLMPFAFFEINNLEYWLKLAIDNPTLTKEILRVQLEVSNRQAWEATDQEFNENLSLQMAILNGHTPVTDWGYKYKANPSHMSALSWYRQPVGEFVNKCHPLAGHYLRNFFYHSGDAMRNMLDESMYWEMDDTKESFLRAIPGYGVGKQIFDVMQEAGPYGLYDRVPDIDNKTMYKIGIGAGMFGVTKRWDVPDNLEAARLKTAQGSWEDFQEDLRKKGLYYNSNTGKVTSIIGGDPDYGLNKRHGNFEETKYWMLAMKGKMWDENIRDWVPLQMWIPYALNDPNLSWEDLLYYKERLHGQKFDMNVKAKDGSPGTFVDIADWTSGGLNDPDLTFLERNKLMMEMHGYRYDSNTGKYIPMDEWEPTGLNEPNLEWNEFCKRMYNIRGLEWDGNKKKFVEAGTSTTGRYDPKAGAYLWYNSNKRKYSRRPYYRRDGFAVRRFQKNRAKLFTAKEKKWFYYEHQTIRRASSPIARAFNSARYTKGYIGLSTYEGNSIKNLDMFRQKYYDYYNPPKNQKGMFMHQHMNITKFLHIQRRLTQARFRPWHPPVHSNWWWLRQG